MIQTKTTANSQTWTSYLRVRVGQSVTYNGTTYISATGVNVVPGTTNDFVSLGGGTGGTVPQEHPFTSSAGQRIFNLGVNYNNVVVIVERVPQMKGIDFTYENGVVEFTDIEGLDLGDRVSINGF